MADLSVWYLVIHLMSSTMPVSSDVSRGLDPLLGPVSQSECESAKAAIGKLPDVFSAHCRKAVAYMSVADGPLSTVRPIFEGDNFVSVGSAK